MKYHKKLDARGDTIVEVMIVLAILGFAIGLAYATANKSLLATRAAEESSEATVLIQTQAERIRAFGGTYPAQVFSTTDYCITNDTPTFKPSTDAACAAYTSPTSSVPYAISIHCDTCTTGASISSPHDTFTIKATWDDVSGQGPKDGATLLYRYHGENR